LGFYNGECWTAFYDDLAFLAILVHGRSRDKDGLGFVPKKKTHAKISPIAIPPTILSFGEIVCFGQRVREFSRRGQRFGKREFPLLSANYTQLRIAQSKSSTK
jgi:hypothetical protein